MVTCPSLIVRCTQSIDRVVCVVSLDEKLLKALVLDLAILPIASPLAQAMAERGGSPAVGSPSSKQSRWEALNAEMQQNAKERKRAYRRIAEGERRGLRLAAQRDTAQTLVALHNGVTKKALAFLRFEGVSESDMGRCGAGLQAWWDGASLAERREASHHPRTARQRAARKKALQFDAEMDLEAWVEKLNLEQGITPRSSVVLRQLHRMDTHRELTAAPGRRNLKRKHQYQWLRRWRRRWHLRMAKLQPLQRLSPEESRAKVRAIGSALKRRPLPEQETCGAAPEGTHGWATRLGLWVAPPEKKGGRKTVPF